MNDEIPLIEGDEAPPEIVITPTDSVDDDMSDVPEEGNTEDLPLESFMADPDDHKGHEHRDV